MIQLPSSTLFGRRVPKQKFYEHAHLTPALRDTFTSQIRAIYWRNKLSPDTINISPGAYVTEVEIFEIRLAAPDLPEAALRLIDTAIPYHLLFLLTWEDRVQAWIGWKDGSGSSIRYYHTPWTAADALSLHVEGLTTDAVYENFLRQIGGPALDTAAPMADSVEKDARRQALEKQLRRLEKQIAAEKQMNRQLPLYESIQEIRKQLDALARS